MNAVFNLVFISMLWLTGHVEIPAFHDSHGKVIYHETMEGAKPFANAHRIECGSWPYAMNIVTDPVFQGRKAVRFEIRKDQELVQNGKRAEVTIIKGLPGKDMWYSFAVYFPSIGLEVDSQREIISQWYQDGSPSMSLRIRNDRLYLEVGPKEALRKQFDIAAIEKNRWHTIVLHIVHAHGAEGRVDVWYDRKKVISQTGGNMYDDVLPKWKIGLYKAAFKFGTSAAERRIIFFDDIRVGSSAASYQDMEPRAK